MLNTKKNQLYNLTFYVGSSHFSLTLFFLFLIQIQCSTVLSLHAFTLVFSDALIFTPFAWQIQLPLHSFNSLKQLIFPVMMLRTLVISLSHQVAHISISHLSFLRDPKLLGTRQTLNILECKDEQDKFLFFKSTHHGVVHRILSYIRSCCPHPTPPPLFRSVVSTGSSSRCPFLDIDNLCVLVTVFK